MSILDFGLEDITVETDRRMDKIGSAAIRTAAPKCK